MPGDNTAVEFGDEIESVPAGTKYESVTLADGRTIEKGDVVVYDDRDVEVERGVHSRSFVGWVEAVMDPERGDEPEVMTSAGIGRIAVSEAEVSGKGSRVDPQTGLAKFVDQFLNRDCDELKLEWGEDIRGTGEEFLRQTA